MIKKILDFCIISGESVKKYDGIKKYVATGDIIDNKISSYTEVAYNNKPSRANQIAKNGEVIFAKMKDTKKIITINEENSQYIYSTGFYIIKPKENILTDYLYWLFNSPKFNIDKDKYCKGATQKALNNEGLSKITIKELPNIEIQKSIVCKLNKVNEIISKKKEQLIILDELIKSQFVEMFEKHDFKKCELKDVANIGSSKRIYANEYKEKGIPFYRSKEIRELGSGLKPSIELFISEDKYDEVKQKYGVPKKGDILIAAIGATIGYMWVVDDSKFYYKDGNLILISIEKDINSSYLRYCLEGIIADFKEKNASGSAQLAMTIEKVEKFSIPIPPINLQNKFADFVKQVDKQKIEIENSLKEMQELYDSLMDKYFG